MHCDLYISTNPSFYTLYNTCKYYTPNFVKVKRILFLSFVRRFIYINMNRRIVKKKNVILPERLFPDNNYPPVQYCNFDT